MKFLDEVIILRRTTSNFEIMKSDNSGVEYEVAQEASDCDYEESSMSTPNNSTKTSKRPDKYEAAISQLCASANSKPLTIFQTFSSTVAVQLEEIHKLDVAEAFSCMQGIQNLIGNKIAELLKNKIASQTRCCITQNIYRHISPSPTASQHSIESNLLGNHNAISPVPSTSTSTPINYKKHHNSYTTYSNSPDHQETSNSTGKNIKMSVITPIQKNSTNYNKEVNISPPLQQPIPESKRIKILDDVMVMFKYDKSCLLNDAIMSAGITDEDNSDSEYLLDDILTEY